MILFRCSPRGGDTRTEEDDYFAPSLRVARAYTMAYLAGKPTETIVVVGRCATNPKLHGARLMLAALNRVGWMAEGSLVEIERWANLNGTPQTLPKNFPRKGAA